MRRVALFLSACFTTAALAAPISEWVFGYKPFSGEYAVYGGSIGDPVAPVSANNKISFSVSDGVAKEIFNSIGPDIKGGCGAEGTRIRQKDRISCSFDKETGYMCHFGFDLRTGKSIGGSVC